MTNWGVLLRAGFVIASEICKPDNYGYWNNIEPLKKVKNALDALFNTAEYKEIEEIAGSGLDRAIKRIACMKVLLKPLGEAIRSRDAEKVKEELKTLASYAAALGLPIPAKAKELVDMSGILTAADVFGSGEAVAAGGA